MLEDPAPANKGQSQASPLWCYVLQSFVCMSASSSDALGFEETFQKG